MRALVFDPIQPFSILLYSLSIRCNVSEIPSRAGKPNHFYVIVVLQSFGFSIVESRFEFYIFFDVKTSLFSLD